MNRHIVIFNADQAIKFSGRPELSDCEVYTLDQVRDFLNSDATEEDKSRFMHLEETDSILLVGSEPFKMLQERYHFGIRSENYFDCSKLYRLSIEGGSFAKVLPDEPNGSEIDSALKDFLDPNFAKPIVYSFKQKIIKTLKDTNKFFDYLNKLPMDTDFGFDYEASGMPLDIWFEISGASICTTKYGGFISFTDLRNICTESDYNSVLKKLAEFLVERQSHIWTYNMQYEYQVSHRVLGVDLYNLCDASSYNVIDGYHLKKYSLKWTAQRVLGVTVWDTEFDRISELIDSMLFETIGELKRDKRKVLKVDKYTYRVTPEWMELCRLYPDYVSEFEALIEQYWGNPFMCIPSDILGYYCNLDSYYTLMIHAIKSKEYSKEAIETFLDNTRLGARLHSHGLYIDEKFRQKYHDEGVKMMAWGITYCATARCKILMNHLQSKMANIKKYSDTSILLLKRGKFFNGNTVEIAKFLLINNLDYLDCYDMGIDEGKLLIEYGPEFASEFLDLIKKSREAVKMKVKIDDSIVRKRKILDLISNGLKELLKIDSIKLDKKHEHLEEYLQYERLYNALLEVSKTQLNDINNIPTMITFEDSPFELLDYSEYISENIFKCKSPIENDKICLEFVNEFPSESCYLAAILESTQQLDGAEKFYDKLGIKTIEDAFNHFLSELERYKTTGNSVYPFKVFNLALNVYGEDIRVGTLSDPLKEIWSNFNGYNAQEQFFRYVSNQYEDYGKTFSEDDLTNRFFFMRKFVINYLLYKKYAKVLSTYIDGMFKKNNVWVIEDEKHIPIRYADPSEPGAVEKCMVHYEVNTKSSKRWSSGFHTIISHADLKDCITTPPAKWRLNENGDWEKEFDFILTYFDISSAEVKAAGFASGDPELIRLFREGIDVNI